MNNEVLIINGPPGSGKSTLADAVSDLLREANVPNVVIDVDELARTYPEQKLSFQWDNLKAIWPRYAEIDDIKAILPVLIDTNNDLEQLKNAVPTSRFMICELTAPEAVLKDRVTKREPNQYWQNKLRGLVDNYMNKPNNIKFGDFTINTHSNPIYKCAEEIIEKADWK